MIRSGLLYYRIISIEGETSNCVRDACNSSTAAGPTRCKCIKTFSLPLIPIRKTYHLDNGSFYSERHLQRPTRIYFPVTVDSVLGA